MTGRRALRSSPLAAAFLVLVALVAVGTLYAFLSAKSTADAASGPASELQLGRKLFLSGCASCHGVNLEGGLQPDGTVAGPSLVGVGAAAVDFQVGTGRMPLANPNAQAPRKPVVYTQEQIAALASYVASVAPGPAVPDQAALDLSGADVALGGNLFRANCASCHNFAAQGGVLTNGKYAPSMDKATDQQIWEAMLTGPQNMPVFPDTTLTPSDKRAILAYINTVQRAPNTGGIDLGRVGPVTEGLLFWIVGIGAMIAAAVWIGVRAK